MNTAGHDENVTHSCLQRKYGVLSILVLNLYCCIDRHKTKGKLCIEYNLTYRSNFD
jgi:hypothetical protein